MSAIRLRQGLCFFFVVVGCGRQTAILPPPAACENKPLSIVLHVHCPSGMTFNVSMNSAGDTQVAMEGTPNAYQKSIALPAATQERLRHLVKDVRFFTLPSSIGRPVGDDTQVVVTVALGLYAHVVTVYTSSLDTRRSEAQEAQRIGLLCRGIVDSISNHLSDGDVLNMPSLDSSWFGEPHDHSEVDDDLPPE